jgi:preprotein translocase subunit YajC
MVIAIVVFMMGMMQLSAKHRVKIKIKKTKMFNKGDKVSVLDEAINGVVLSVNDKHVP